MRFDIFWHRSSSTRFLQDLDRAISNIEIIVGIRKGNKMALNQTEQTIIDRLNKLPAAVTAKIAEVSGSTDNADFIGQLQSGLTTLESALAPASSITPPA